MELGSFEEDEEEDEGDDNDNDDDDNNNEDYHDTEKRSDETGDLGIKRKLNDKSDNNLVKRRRKRHRPNVQGGKDFLENLKVPKEYFLLPSLCHS